MDDLSLEQETMDAVLYDITRANHWLGGNAITVNAVLDHIKLHPQAQYRIVDVGCGDGDMLREIAKALRKKSITAALIGVDINERSIAVASTKSQAYPEISYESRDILTTDPSAFRCDILLCTLTMHHFRDPQIIDFIKSFMRVTDGEIIINDLQRSRLAYLLFLPFSWVFMRTSIARQDGLVSIQRSFSRTDLMGYATALGLESYTIKWKWAFRYLWRIKMI